MDLDVVDRLSELPFRLRAPSRRELLISAFTTDDRSRVSIAWPASYQWVHTSAFVDSIRGALNRLGVLHIQSIPQTHRGVVTLPCVVDGRTHVLVLDYSDHPDSINESALAVCSLYIKFQFLCDGYADSRIVAGGYPVSSTQFYRYYRAFRRRYDGRPEVGVFARFGYAFQGALRRRAVELLSSAPDIHFLGAGRRVRYSRFLRESASARLCLDLPGNGPFTFRLPETLGLGSCLIAPRYVTRLQEKLEPGVHYVAIADDLSDLLDVCRYYLAHESERAAIARAGRDFFDMHLHCDALAEYYVSTILARLGN